MLRLRSARSSSRDVEIFDGRAEELIDPDARLKHLSGGLSWGRHDEIRPEMVETLREAGVRNYSIFRYGLTLFGYFETDDIERTQQYLSNSEVSQR